MDMICRNKMKPLLLLGLSGMLLAGCSDWTRPEPIPFRYVKLEEKNPGLYQDYMESLRDYHESERKLLIAKFDNVSQRPSGRSEHVNCLPDSTDYVILTSVSSMSEFLQKDLADLQTNKGTKVLAQVDVNELTEKYKLYVEEKAEEEVMPFSQYISQEMPAWMEAFGQYDYDGINVLWTGRNPESCIPQMLEELKAEQTAFLTPLLDWLDAHEGKLFFLEGSPQYLLLDRPVAKEADYILVPALSARTSAEFTHQVNKVLMEGNVPVDRIVLVVTTPSLTDPSLPEGHFSERNPDGTEMSAIVGGAHWVNGVYESFLPKGLAVAHAQNDYFDLNKTFSEIRSAISIMNPSPIK